MTAIQISRPAPRSGSAASSSIGRHAALVLVAAAVAVAAWLRILEARGDLWLDEIWSLDLVSTVHSPFGVLWGLSHDNNHLLNSLWLYALGPGQPPWVYRAPAVAAGALSVVVAARIGLRQSPAAGVAAASLAASAMPLVVYGSEARGYGGLILATLAAIDCFERAMAEPPSPRSGWRRPSAWWLGLAVGFGTLCHLTMLATPAVLGLAALMRFRERGRALPDALDLTVDLFGPSLVMLLPAMASLLAGIAVTGGFTFGDVEPFQGRTFASGYGDQLRFMLGLPAGVPAAVAFTLAASLLVASLRIARVDPARRWIALAALLVIPGAMALARLPNLEYPRYFLVPGLVLMLVEADVVGRLWDSRTPRGRVAAAALLGALLAGQAVADRTAIAAGRGRYGDALALMAAEGRPTYTADQRFMVETVARYTAARRGVAAGYVPPEAFCATPPDWAIDALDRGATPPSSVTRGPAACRLRYDRRAVFPSGPLSGVSWTLYRRAG